MIKTLILAFLLSFSMISKVHFWETSSKLEISSSITNSNAKVLKQMFSPDATPCLDFLNSYHRKKDKQKGIDVVEGFDYTGDFENVIKTFFMYFSEKTK